MNKIINNKRYNTDVAKQIGYVDSGVPATDFTFWRETLYRSKTGRYFLHCEGHGNSKYGEWHGNSGGWGEKISPVTEETARIWAEENLTAEEVEITFGVSCDEKEKISVDLHPAVKQKLDQIKGKESYGDIITKMVNAYEQNCR